MKYSDYTFTIKTDCSYWGSIATADEAADMVNQLAARLTAEFPGLNIRYCPMIGWGRLDDTAGPDQAICDQIDNA